MGAQVGSAHGCTLSLYPLKALFRALWMAPTFVLVSGLMPGCAREVRLTATTMQPAGLALRAFPEVFILRGHLDEEARIGRGLAEHLERFGHIKTHHLDEEELRTHLLRGPVPRAAAIVELQLDLSELMHHQFGAPVRTVCDSLSCYIVPSRNSQDMPVMRATLTVTVRDAVRMNVWHRVWLRAFERGGDSEEMRREVTLTLIQRARVLIDHRRMLVQVSLLAPDVPGVDEALSAAEKGDWAGSGVRLRAALRRHGRTIGRVRRAQLLHDIAQTQRLASEATDPGALLLASRTLAQARRLDPGNEVYREAARVIARDLKHATTIRRQWVAAGRNFRRAGPRKKPDPSFRSSPPPRSQRGGPKGIEGASGPLLPHGQYQRGRGIPLGSTRKAL